ncbi:MAG: STAS-like domain-containing protein [Lachnospiraceae bacterium]|nr:STAS-like domain-containing protein [Lachnospiraceae bacterium]
MANIYVNDFLPRAFSNDQAELLKQKINEVINHEDKIVLDFSGITKFTTLFFNFSMGYFITQLGKEKYDSMFELKNLNQLGESTYIHSYNNSVRDELSGSEEMKAKIMDIINSSDEI